VPASSVKEIEEFLRSYDVTPRPDKLPDLKLKDKDDLVIIASALAASAEILITGDRELIELREKPKGLKICSPRDFWNLLSGTGKP
jgi:predicted nucleic acid-binding protein